jgi:K+-transporting ATPase ATPase C chain
MTLLTGIIYPLAITGMAQLLFNKNANGSLIKNSVGTVVGSSLIAQRFQDPKYFWPRPSSIDYNPMPSGGSNLGPTSADLLNKVTERRANGASGEMLFASASGLDPHISPKAAVVQAARIAQARHVTLEQVLAILSVDKSSTFIQNRQFGFLGEERVNVLELNLALDERLNL